MVENVMVGPKLANELLFSETFSHPLLSVISKAYSFSVHVHAPDCNFYKLCISFILQSIISTSTSIHTACTESAVTRLYVYMCICIDYCLVIHGMKYVQINFLHLNYAHRC